MFGLKTVRYSENRAHKPNSHVEGGGEQRKGDWSVVDAPALKGHGALFERSWPSRRLGCQLAGLWL